MKLFAFLMVVLVACNKPSEEACTKAIENIQRILGSEGGATDVKGQIRRCKGGSSKEAVECASKATTRKELLDCKMNTFDDAPAPGSAAPGSGSPAGSAE
jgi:hypothetical protein